MVSCHGFAAALFLGGSASPLDRIPGEVIVEELDVEYVLRLTQLAENSDTAAVPWRLENQRLSLSPFTPYISQVYLCSIKCPHMQVPVTQDSSGSMRDSPHIRKLCQWRHWGCETWLIAVRVLDRLLWVSSAAAGHPPWMPWFRVCYQSWRPF